jgi:hypothetical protein
VGLLAGCLALSVGSPVLLVTIPLAMALLLLPGAGMRGGLIGGGLLVLALVGGPPGGMTDIDRGWAILLGGGFVAATMSWPDRSFTERGLAALALAAIWGAVVLLTSGGWPVLEGMVEARIATGMEATLELGRSWMGGGEGGFADAAARTAEVQLFLFPAQAAVAALLGLGGAWWLHQRIALGRTDGVGALRAFSFPDALIWVLIGGIGLTLAFGWTGGFGQVGANLAAFMGTLFALRGVAVLLVLSGGLGLVGGLLVLVGLVVAAPLLAAGAMALGLGDVWFDLRSRADRNAISDPE